MRRRIAAAGLAALAIAGAAVGFWPHPPSPPPKPELALLTSLPLMFGEHFGLDGGGSPALARIERDFVVHPIAVADAASLRGQRLLLMAHPRAQPAEALVALDEWVRGGGRVLLLADPRLDWPSERPLGDPLRPPPWFADTGLLGHWGLKLDAPAEGEVPTRIDVGGFAITTDGPGRLRLAGAGGCSIAAAGLIARCRIGQGRAVVVADADFLLPGDGEAMPGRGRNLDLLTRELETLATH